MAASSNTLLIASGGTVTSKGGAGTGLAVGNTHGLGNQLVVTNGGRLVTADNSYIGRDDSSAGSLAVRNGATITGDGSIWDAGGARVFIGNTQSSLSNSLTVTAGGVVTNAFVSFGNTDASSLGGGPRYSRLTITDGGRVFSSTGFQPAGNSNAVHVGGGTRASLWNLRGNPMLMPQAINFDFSGLDFTIDALGVVTNIGSLGFNLGWTQGKKSNDNRFTVKNGGQLWVSAGNFAISRLWSGSSSASRNAVLITTGGRAMVPHPQTVTVGAAGWSNTLFVTDGGILEANTLTVDAKAGNVISNRAGVLQFTVGTPAITPGVFGRIGVENGAVSFRRIDTADVFCNGAGKSLDAATRVAWSGANAFRLDSATNLAGQAYTFAAGLGAANFARMELLNAARYRGNVTVGNGGGLLSSNGLNTVSGDLSMQPGAVLSVDLDAPEPAGLAVTGTADFGGADLTVALRRAPERGTRYRVVEAAGGVGTRLGSPTVAAEFGGQTYALSVRYDATGVLLGYAPLGAVIILR